MPRVNSGSSPPAWSAPPAEARPVDGSERLLLLDALRGFALCGVFVANLYVWFSGRNFLPYAQLDAAEASASVADLVTARAIPFLVYGKFMTLFSFLFGLGFAVQMGRAEQRGASIVPLYSRRLGVLLAIGLSHLFLLWYGDILSSYALLGFGLMLFRKRSDKTVLLWAAALILVAPLVGSFLFRIPRLFGSAEATAAASAAAKAALEHSEAVKTATLAAITSGGYFDVLRAQAAFYFGAYTTPLITVVFTLLGVLGRFLLGMVTGRRGLFHEPSQHLPFFRKVLVWGLVAGMIGNGAGLVFQQLFIRKVLNPRSVPWFPFVMTLMGHVGEVGLAAFYGASITLLFQRPVWQRLLSVLAPVGRMALTSYLSQTVISLLLFYGYGLGLVGQFGPAVLLAISLGIFVVQIGVSHLWLARFRFGPVEWVWRSLTYGKAQPMRRAVSADGMSANMSAGSS